MKIMKYYYINKKILDNVEFIVDSGGYFIYGDDKRTAIFTITCMGWDNNPVYSSSIEKGDVDWGNDAVGICITYNVGYGGNSIEGTVWVEYTKITD